MQANTHAARLSIALCIFLYVLLLPMKSRGQPTHSLTVMVDVSVSGGVIPTVRGTTNLPDGSLLWIRLWPPYPACFGYCSPAQVPASAGHTDEMGGAAVVVEHGSFAAGPVWQVAWKRSDGTPGLNPGRYILEVSFDMIDSGFPSTSQPASVQVVLGRRGENMSGPLVGACCFGYGMPGRHMTAADATKEADGARALAQYYGPGVYFARYVDIR